MTNIPGLLVDEQDKHLLDKYNFRLRNRGYAGARLTKNKTVTNIWIHRLITDCPANMVVDHINHNHLDNRRNNLRVCTHAENMRNTVTPKSNTTGCKGVVWSFQRNKYKVSLRLNGKSYHLGYFSNIEDASKAYELGAKKYHGDYAYVADRV